MYLPSEIARLVLGYLMELKCHKTMEMFLCECKQLEEFVQALDDDFEYPTKIDGKSLLDILIEYANLKRNGFNISQCSESQVDNQSSSSFIKNSTNVQKIKSDRFNLKDLSDASTVEISVHSSIKKSSYLDACCSPIHQLETNEYINRSFNPLEVSHQNDNSPSQNRCGYSSNNVLSSTSVNSSTISRIRDSSQLSVTCISSSTKSVTASTQSTIKNNFKNSSNCVSQEIRHSPISCPLVTDCSGTSNCFNNANEGNISQLPLDSTLIMDGETSIATPESGQPYEVPHRHPFYMDSPETFEKMQNRFSNYTLTTPVKSHLRAADSPRRKNITPRRRLMPGTPRDKSKVVEDNSSSLVPLQNPNIELPVIQNEDSDGDFNSWFEQVLNAQPLHEKIAENINKVVKLDTIPEIPAIEKPPERESAEKLSNSQQELNISDQVIREIISKTQSDPAFESLLSLFDVKLETPSKNSNNIDTHPSVQENTVFHDVSLPQDNFQPKSSSDESIKTISNNIINAPTSNLVFNPGMPQASASSSSEVFKTPKKLLKSSSSSEKISKLPSDCNSLENIKCNTTEKNTSQQPEKTINSIVSNTQIQNKTLANDKGKEENVAGSLSTNGQKLIIDKSGNSKVESANIKQDNLDGMKKQKRQRRNHLNCMQRRIYNQTKTKSPNHGVSKFCALSPTIEFGQEFGCRKQSPDMKHLLGSVAQERAKLQTMKGTHVRNLTFQANASDAENINAAQFVAPILYLNTNANGESVLNLANFQTMQTSNAVPTNFIVTDVVPSPVVANTNNFVTIPQAEVLSKNNDFQNSENFIIATQAQSNPMQDTSVPQTISSKDAEALGLSSSIHFQQKFNENLNCSSTLKEVSSQKNITSKNASIIQNVDVLNSQQKFNENLKFSSTPKDLTNIKNNSKVANKSRVRAEKKTKSTKKPDKKEDKSKPENKRPQKIKTANDPAAKDSVVNPKQNEMMKKQQSENKMLTRSSKAKNDNTSESQLPRRTRTRNRTASSPSLLKENSELTKLKTENEKLDPDSRNTSDSNVMQKTSPRNQPALNTSSVKASEAMGTKDKSLMKTNSLNEEKQVSSNPVLKEISDIEKTKARNQSSSKPDSPVETQDSDLVRVRAKSEQELKSHSLKEPADSNPLERNLFESYNELSSIIKEVNGYKLTKNESTQIKIKSDLEKLEVDDVNTKVKESDKSKVSILNDEKQEKIEDSGNGNGNKFVRKEIEEVEMTESASEECKTNKEVDLFIPESSGKNFVYSYFKDKNIMTTHAFRDNEKVRLTDDAKLEFLPDLTDDSDEGEESINPESNKKEENAVGAMEFYSSNEIISRKENEVAETLIYMAKNKTRNKDKSGKNVSKFSRDEKLDKLRRNKAKKFDKSDQSGISDKYDEPYTKTNLKRKKVSFDVDCEPSKKAKTSKNLEPTKKLKSLKNLDDFLNKLHGHSS